MSIEMLFKHFLSLLVGRKELLHKNTKGKEKSALAADS